MSLIQRKPNCCFFLGISFLIISFFFLLKFFSNSFLIKKTFPEQNTSTHVTIENRPSHRDHPYGGTLRWGTINAPLEINPLVTASSVSASIQGLIFNGLVKVNEHFGIEPDLAERWEVSEDGLVYTFYLRKGVLFHDGIELTAEDVVFTYQQHINGDNNSSFRSRYDSVEELEALAPYIFRITLKEPFPSLLSGLVREIVPKHLLEGKNDAEFGQHPVGTGPFQFKSWDKGSNEIRLTANPVYFEGRPYLDEIVIKVFPDNSFLWAALMRDEVDFVKFLNRDDFTVLKGDQKFKTFLIPAYFYLALLYNQHDPQLFDKEVRRSIASAVNVEQLILATSTGGIPCLGPVHPQSTGFNTDIKGFDYNPVRARMDLMTRGWRDVDGDGIFEKGGSELTLRMLVDQDNEYYLKLAKMIRQMLAQVGIKTHVIRYNDEDELTEEFIARHKPQAWLRFFQGIGSDPYEAVTSWYSGSTQFGTVWDFHLDFIDELYEQGRRETDPDKKLEIYQKIHEFLYEEQPACFLFFPVTFHAVNARFKNTDAFFSATMPDYSIKDWHL
ncbi:MAG: ABC transporter substrate-binding protein [Candidatus Omnitrophota bacterium]